MTTVYLPEDWPTGCTAYNGAPPSSTIPRTLEARNLFLSAVRKQAVFVPLSGGVDGPITSAEASSGTPGSLRVYVQPWTKFLMWSVLAVGDSDTAVVYTQRTEIDGAASVETYEHMIPCPGFGGDLISAASFYTSRGTPDADDMPQHIDCGTISSSRKSITISFWLDGGAEVYGFVFESLREYTITG